MPPKATRPNVLFIMADQHRADFIGCAGAGFIHTPNLDSIAARGMRFTQCATNSPVCAPARIALASGLQPFRMGSVDNNSFLPLSTPTYYQRFRDHGYRVGCVGKLDLAKPDPYNGRYGDRPCGYAWGFTHPEECEGKQHAGSSPTPLGPYGYYLQELGLLEAFYQDYRHRHSAREMCRDSVLPTEAFEDCYIGRRAARWIREVPDDFPWFYFVSFVGPHNPFDPPTEYAERYRHAEMPPAIADGLQHKPAWVQERVRTGWHHAGATPEEVAISRRQYCASTTAIDDQIGSILEALEGRGMAESTYIVYTSDHGEMCGDHGLYTKHYAYEASLMVPLIVSGPGIPAGAVSDALVELMDANATVCDLAGLPPLHNVDARSFAPVLHGKTAEHRAELLSTIDNFQCLRTERFKYVNNYNDIPELYDLVEDPSELHNLAAERPEAVRELAQRMMKRNVEGQWLR